MIAAWRQWTLAASVVLLLAGSPAMGQPTEEEGYVDVEHSRYEFAKRSPTEGFAL